MNVVSLTTDFGWQDYYVGVLKGEILRHEIPVTFADITHSLDNFNIAQASYIVKNTFPSFPKNSIHLISVNNYYCIQPRFLAIKHKDHYFIGADNGIFSLIFDEQPEEVFELNYDNSQKICIEKIFAKAVGHILAKKPLEEIGVVTNYMVQRLSIQPITGKDHIRGSIIHIDKYKNVILNIDKALFERIGKNRSFELYFKRHDPITDMHSNYADVAVGEVLCFFNSAGLLELAVNCDKAATLYGLELDETIQIDFLNPPTQS